MMISKTTKKSRSSSRNFFLHWVLLELGLFLFSSFSLLLGQEADPIATGEVTVLGVRLQVSPTRQTVPINTETIVNTVFSVVDAELLEGLVVKGTLRGPGIKDSITLTTLPSHPFAVPGFTTKGTYTLGNIRLEKDDKVLIPAEPDSASIEAMDIIVTRVETRPLTLEEIREKGIVISQENFSVYNFSVGFMVNSQEVKYEFPVVYSGNNEVYIPTRGEFGLGLGPSISGRGVEPLPISFELPELPVPSDEGGTETSQSITGVVIFNNDIAFLNQFFSVMFIVSNHAPQDSALALKNLTAKITFPDGLREAQTNPPHVLGAPVPVRCPGPDGKIGTADDLDIILTTFSGMAEFLAEGIKEGTHYVDIDFEGTLSGLPSGDTPITGTATGAVIVRNPEFGITFAHPAVIRKGEEYDIFITMTNTSPVTANLVSLTMPATRLVGTTLLGEETVSFETIEPGVSVNATFHMRANETGKVFASAFEADGQVSGKFVLTAGVGEKGIILSPDTLTLPTWAYSLPNELINASLMLLGEAYSIATTPPGGLPEGLPYISTAVVKERAVEFAEAGQRYSYGDPLINTLEVLTLDWLGSQLTDINFDILRRLTTKGLKLAQQQALYFNEALGTQTTAVDFQRSFAETCSYKAPFISVLLSGSGSTRTASLRITDYYQNRLSNEYGYNDLIRDIPYAELYALENSNQAPVDFALVGHLEETNLNYKVEIFGETDGSFDLALVVPDGNGGFRQVAFPGIACNPGSVSTLLISGTSTNVTITPLSTDTTGDGQADTQAPGNAIPIQPPALQLIRAVQECSADSAGHATALFFNRPVDPETAKDKANYYIAGKSIYAAYRQPSGRVILIGTNNPISPFVETKVRVENLKDVIGSLLSPSPVEMTIIATIKTPGGIVYGQVLTAEGNPIPNAKIQLVEHEDEKRTLCFAISDATGNYQFDFVRILVDPFTIEVLDPATGKVEKISSRLLSHGQRLQLSIIFRGRGSIQGQVLDTAGTPVSGAGVVAQPENAETWEAYGDTTDENGTYFIQGIPIGRVSLSARKGSSFGSASTAITAPGQVQTADITIVGVKTASVTGRVLYCDGLTPVAQTYVNLYGPNSFASGTKTDDQGNFQFPTVPVGSITIQAYNLQTGKVGGQATSTLTEGQVFNATIILRGTGRVYGKVLSYDGQPQPGVFIYLVGTSFYMDTDGNGEFDFPQVPMGTYTINATHRTTYATASASVKLITEGQEAYAALVFSNMVKGSITGKVYDENGTALSNIDVYAADGNFIGRGVGKSSSNGTFQIDNLSPGSYILFVVKGDKAGLSRVSVKYAGHVAPCDVKLLGKGKVIIKVLNSTGNTGVMAQVTFRRPVFKLEEGDSIGFYSEEEQYNTDENGNLEIDNVYMGGFAVSAKNAFYPRGATSSGSITSPGQVVNVTLQMRPTGKVKLHVVSWNGQDPVAGAELEFKSGKLNYKGIYTDSNGDYEFTLVPPGSFQVTAYDSVSGLKGIRYGTMGEDGDLVEVTLRLLGTGTVSGVVKQLPARLVPNASVSIKNVGYPHAIFKTNTDENGQFIQSGVWEGQFTVSAFDTVTQSGGVGWGEITGHNAQANVEVTIAPVGTIKGKVLSPDGITEMTDVQVIMYHSKFSYAAVGYSYVGEPGGYTFESVPVGQFYLEALHPGSGRKGQKYGTMPTNGGELEVNVQLEGRGTVTGTFFDGSKVDPIPYASIKITSKGQYPFTLVSSTNDEGRFTFREVGVGAFDLQATDASNGLMGTATGKVEYDEETVEIDVYAQGWGSVRGFVYEANGVDKVPSAYVVLTQGNKKYTAYTGSVLNPPTGSSEYGEYSIDFVPTGSFSIAATEQSGRDYGTATGKVEFHGQEAVVNIIFKGLGTVRGRVLDGSSNPVGDIPVILKSGNETFTTSSSNDPAILGQFEFAEVRMGSFSLEAKQPVSNLAATYSGELISNNQEITVDLTLESAGSVTGRVLNPDGSTPAGNAYIKLKSGTYSKYYNTTGTGEFTFEGVRLGSVSVEILGYNNTGKARVYGELKYHGDLLGFGDVVLDNQPPEVTGITPSNGSTTPSLNVPITIAFSEPMAAASITTTTIKLTTPQGQSAAGSRQLSSDYKTLTFTPTASLASFTMYTVVVDDAVTDVAGNTMAAPVSSSFTTIDTVPPLVVSVQPANNATGIATNAVITVFFNEAIDPGNFTDQNLKITKGGASVNGTVSVNTGNTSATFTPSPSPLETDSTYKVTVLGARDFTGNTQTTAFTSTFNTTDTIAPTLTLSTDPVSLTVIEGTTVKVTANVGSSTDVAVVYFFVNGELKVSDTTSPYIYSFTAPFISQSGNTFLVEAMAVDKAGNQSSKVNCTFTLKVDASPAVTLTGPTTSDVYPRGTIDCTVAASDDLSLSRVTLTAAGGNLNYIDNQTFTTTKVSFSKSYTIPVAADLLPGTTILLHAEAEDNRGKVTQAADISLHVPQDEQAPQVTINSPTENNTFVYGEDIPIDVDVTDDVALKEVRIYFNDTLLGTFNQSECKTTYNATINDGTTAVIRVEAEDLLGHLSTASVNINLKEPIDPNAPTVKILSPSEGTLVYAGETLKIKIEAVAKSPCIVTKVDVFVDDQNIQELTAAPYEVNYTIPADAAAGSTITIKAVATDSVNLTGTAQSIVEVVSGAIIPAGTVIEANNAAYDNQTIIINEGTVTINGAHTFVNVLVKGSGILTHSAATSTMIYTMQLTITRKLAVGPDARISVNGCGYLGACRGNNTGTNYGRTLGNTTSGGSGYNSGGSYGGYGAKNSTYALNEVYGSLYLPSDPGSGGGGNATYQGGSGGGVIMIDAGEINLEGGINANGQYGNSSGGGGSGGSIQLHVTALKGSGTITANGVCSTSGYGSGGGRISVYYEYATQYDLSKITAYGGKYSDGSDSTRNGSAGTIYLEQTGQEPQLIINNNGTQAYKPQIFPAVGPASITALSANVLTDSNASFMAGSLKGMKLIPNTANKNQTFTIIDNTKTTITTDPAEGDLTTAAAVGNTYGGMGIFDGHLKIKNTYYAEINGGGRLGNLSVIENSRLCHPTNTSSKSYYLYLQVPGTIFVDETSLIWVNGRGYLGAFRGDNSSSSGRTLGNIAGSGYNSGGSYGGYGAKYDTYAVNEVYGSLYLPSDPGSGGGGNATYQGGSGGGVIMIDAGEINLEGGINANGQYGNSSGGGGSGGSIQLHITTLKGSGTITANGVCSTSGYGGGGGRIAVYYEDATQYDISKITAYGGKYGDGSTTARNGSAGTIYLEKKGEGGEIIIDNNTFDSTNGTPLLGAPGTITALEPHKLVDSNANFVPGSLVGIKVIPNINQEDSFTIISNTKTELFTAALEGDMTLKAAVGDKYGFKYPGHIVLDGIRSIYNGNFTFSEMTLINSSLKINGDFEADRLTLQNGSVITHSTATKSVTCWMNLQVNDLLIDESSSIQANGCGYLGGWRGDNQSNIGRTLGNTTTGGSDTYSGGSYGGYAGMHGTYAVNHIYGSIYRPVHPGSGGGGAGSGQPGGSGGGVIRITADEIVNNGVISANGGDADEPGAGSGGSVWIDTATLSGSGIISAKGGISEVRRCGGGGRAAVYYNDASNFNLSAITAYGGTNLSTPTSSWQIGSAGSVYLKKNGEEGQLIINNRDNGSQNPRIVPDIKPSTITGLTPDTLTDATASFMPGSLVDMELIPNIKNPSQTFSIIDNTNTTITIDAADGDLTTAASVGNTYSGKFVFPGHLRINHCYRANINGKVELGNVSITGNSRLSHTYGSISSEYYLDMKVSGKIFIESGSMLTATGSGYAGGYNSDNTDQYGRTLGNVNGSNQYSGGSYGGYGGKYSTNAVNETYGSIYRPSNPGSGGGGGATSSNLGGMGGGVLHIDSNEIENNGEISANGGDSEYAGAGSGGSILLNTPKLTGSGSITANGGSSTKTSSNNGCGGGGGRIALYYKDVSQFDLTKITAYGGKYAAGSTSTRNGGAGTVFLKHSTDNYGDMIVNNNGTLTGNNSTTLPAVGQGFNTLLEPNRLVNSAASFKPGSLIGIELNPQPTGNTVFTIINNNGTEILTDPADGDMTQIGTAGGPYIGEHHLFHLTIKGSAKLFTTDRIQWTGTLTVEPGSTLKAENYQ